MSKWQASFPGVFQKLVSNKRSETQERKRLVNITKLTKTQKERMLLLFLHPAIPLSLRAQFSQSHSVTDAHVKVWKTAQQCSIVSLHTKHTLSECRLDYGIPLVLWHVPVKAGRGWTSLHTAAVCSIRPFSFFPNSRPIDDLMPFFCLLQTVKTDKVV